MMIGRFKLRPMRAVIVVEAILVFVLLAMSAKEFIVYRFSPGMQLTSEGTGAAQDLTRKNFSAYEKLASSGLFGTDVLSFIDLSASKAAEGSQSPVAIPDVTLIGTVVDADGAGYAVFEDKATKKQEISVIGEAVFGAGILSRLEEKRAYIMLGSKELTYEIFEKKLDGDGTVIQAGQGAAGRGGQASDSAGASVLSHKTGEGRYIIDKRALDSVLSDIGKVLTDARLVPYIENGTVTGFVINEIKPGGVFSLIGLQEGDVLKKINDFEINSPEKGVQLLSGLKGESNLNVDIRRNGQPINLQYQIR